MLPEEVVASLKAGRLANPAVAERAEECLYALLPGQECILAGGDARELRHAFQERTRCRPDDNLLRGTVASRGRAVGPCKVIIRADDCRDFRPGSIVVSESTDPDLIGFLQSAGGVLTEQGGVTSHAAIICRELGIPTIIGIDGLLDRIRDGDVVEVDALQGQVRLLQGREAPAGTVLSPAEASDRIGPKAHNLGLVRSHGFLVPEHVLLDYEAVKRSVGPTSTESRQCLAQWVLEQLDLPPGSKLALRSSASSEDRENGSQAGAFRTLLSIEPERLASAFSEFIRHNGAGQNGSRYRGSIIVQRMIQADHAGVCLTMDERTGNANALILEFLAGGNEALTQGTVRPQRIVVNRLTGDVQEHPQDSETAPALAIPGLVQQFLTLEARFGKPLDIEWALAAGKLYILQARPIAALPGAAATCRAPGDSALSGD
jgi:phosphoenolpyruvate synthase/pyruvate phosphate dikinase